MTPTEIATDIKTFLERGKELLESHVPELVERAQQAEADPLVQAVEAAVLPLGVRQLAAEFITKLAAEFPPPPTPDAVVDDQGAVPAA